MLYPVPSDTALESAEGKHLMAEHIQKLLVYSEVVQLQVSYNTIL